jgi:hypothetical protein
MELFAWKQRQELEEKKIRFKLEKAYEQEKSKVRFDYLIISPHIASVCHHEKDKPDLS